MTDVPGPQHSPRKIRSIWKAPGKRKKSVRQHLGGDDGDHLVDGADHALALLCTTVIITYNHRIWEVMPRDCVGLPRDAQLAAGAELHIPVRPLQFSLPAVPQESLVHSVASLRALCWDHR